jgi:hypothetical protein
VAGLGAELAQGGAKALGKGFDQQRVMGPALSEVDAQRASLSLDGAAVKADAGARVLGRHAKDYGLFDAVGAHLADHIGNVGTPVAHAHVDANRRGIGGRLRLAQFRFYEAALFDGDLRQRAAADEGVAVLNLFDQCLRQRTAADHVAQVLGNLLDGLRGSVGEEENGLFSH